MPGRLLLGWVLLLVLLAAEFGLSFVTMAPGMRVLLMVPAAVMVAVVAVVFMEIGDGPVIVRGFAAAGLVWLFVLLVLGSMDPMTRTDYQVPSAHRD
jgi:cytochrome c oxidase subunit 4